jgi:hypothetical protein
MVYTVPAPPSVEYSIVYMVYTVPAPPVLSGSLCTPFNSCTTSITSEKAPLAVPLNANTSVRFAAC